MGGAREVDACDLQVASVQVTLMEGDAAIGCYLFVSAAAHGIVGAFDHCVAIVIREAHRTVLSIIYDSPNAGFCFN